MYSIDRHYINGEFVDGLGNGLMDLVNPSTGRVAGQVRLGDREDARRAIAAARTAFSSFSKSSIAERIALLGRLHDAVVAKAEALTDAGVHEYGGTRAWEAGRPSAAAMAFLNMAKVLETYKFTRWINDAEVLMTPIGVVGIITPWNGSNGFICGKFAAALAAGCTVVVKPSEMSALQAHLLVEAIHEAGLPKGVFNLVHGRGDVVGSELSTHPDVAKVSFTGSTVVGKSILRSAADTVKRVTLELGGKSPNIILDDADLEVAIPIAVRAGFMNNGQACIAGTRILVPESRADEACAVFARVVEGVKVGDPNQPDTQLGPLVSQTQFERVQRLIRRGIEEGAQIVVGGEGRPADLPDAFSEGYFVRPTVFSGVTPDMAIAQEEIFGPVLSILTYRDEDDAIRIANDTTYGLEAYVSSADPLRARAIAERLEAGRVQMNGITHDPMAPFGGFKQSGLGRELGTFGLEAHLEPKVLFGRSAPS